MAGSFSRRRRRGRRERVTVVLLVLLAAALMVLDAGNDRFAWVRNTASDGFGPVDRGVAAVVNPVGNFFQGLPHVGSRQSEIEKLQRENAQLRSRLKTTGLDKARARELSAAGVLADRQHLRTVTAQVIDYGPSLGFEWTVRVNRGSHDGVTTDMTVIDGDGLVGRVKSVSRSTSTVILAADPGSSVGVRDVRTGELGLVTGGGSGPMRFTPLDPTSTVKTGDVLVTGPKGGSTYAAGIPFGTVTKVTTGGSSTTPTGSVRADVDFSRLDVLQVVLSSPDGSGPAQ